MSKTSAETCNPDLIPLSARVARKMIYKEISRCIAIFEYQEQWRKLKADAICEESRVELSLFVFSFELKEELDKCFTLTEDEQKITDSAKVWYNKLVEEN